jgi:hypothetical protein
MRRYSLLVALSAAGMLACDDATQPVSAPASAVPLILASVQGIPDTGVAYTLCLPATGLPNIDLDPSHFDTLQVVHLDAADDTVTQCGDLGFRGQTYTFAGDGQVDTAAVTVTLDKTAPSCVLKRG